MAGKDKIKETGSAEEGAPSVDWRSTFPELEAADPVLVRRPADDSLGVDKPQDLPALPPEPETSEPNGTSPPVKDWWWVIFLLGAAFLLFQQQCSRDTQDPTPDLDDLLGQQETFDVPALAGFFDASRETARSASQRRPGRRELKAGLEDGRPSAHRPARPNHGSPLRYPTVLSSGALLAAPLNSSTPSSIRLRPSDSLSSR